MFSCPRRLAPLRAAALITLALAAAISSAEALPHSIGGAVAAEAQLKTAQRPANRYHNLFHRSSVRTVQYREGQKKCVLGCENSPPQSVAESRNLGHTFLANSVHKSGNVNSICSARLPNVVREKGMEREGERGRGEVKRQTGQAGAAEKRHNWTKARARPTEPEPCTELAKKVCPRLRDLATVPAGGITQTRTNFFGQLCRVLE